MYGTTLIVKGDNHATMFIDSKKHGKYEVIIDNEDAEKLIELGGKWNVSILRAKPYFQKRVGRREVYQLHRFLLNAPVGTYVDHINRNTLDNRRINLRICSNSANIRNGRIRPNNTSGYTGVRETKRIDKPWSAQIRVKYKVIYLGLFATFQEAVKARKEAEIRYFDV